MVGDVPGPGKRRRDTTENRRAILAAAASALAESGAVSLNSIAKQAGVANATLYRHFPTARAWSWRSTGKRCARSSTQPTSSYRGTRQPMRCGSGSNGSPSTTITKHGLAEALRTATSSDQPLHAETYDQIVGALAKLLAAAEASGDIRPGLDPDDVILALAGLWQIEPTARWRSRARQLYEIVFTGLRR